MSCDVEKYRHRAAGLQKFDLVHLHVHGIRDERNISIFARQCEYYGICQGNKHSHEARGIEADTEGRPEDLWGDVSIHNCGEHDKDI
jgi:hypothetical protein